MTPHRVAALALPLLLAAGSAAAQEAAPIAPAAAPAPAVRVHLRTYKGKGTARAYLHRGDGSYSFVCASPCTADVPVNSEMRVTLANNDEEPHTFTVPGDLGPDVELEVRPASAGPLIGGIVLMGSGGAFVLVGLLLVAFADVGGLSVDGSGGTHSRASNTELKNTGYVFMGIGAAAAAGGLIWLLTRSHEPRVHEAPARGPADVYGRTDTLLGDVAAAKPRDPASTMLPAYTPLTYRFAF